MKVSSQMLENLRYDEIEMSEEPNSLKINSDSKVKHYKIEGLKLSYQEVQQKIKENLDELARIESHQMCIPFTVAKKYFEKASEPIEFFKVDPEFHKKFNQSTTLSALWRTNICKFFENFYFAIHRKCETFNLKVDLSRRNLMTYFFENILKVNLIDAKLEDTNNNLIQPTKVSIIFKSSDINAAVQQIIESVNDPFNATTSINSIYVQECCYDDLCEKLKLQLKPYPKDILRDQFFIEEYNKCMKVLHQLQPKLIQFHQTKSESVVPTICCDFNRNYFQTDSNEFNPIITLQSFRTVKECLSLISEISFENMFSKATIWSYNFATAYEIIYKSNLSDFELNCYNISKYPFYKMFNHNLCFDLDHINNNGVLNTNTHHYQYFQYKKDDKIKFKTVIMAFGVTFAN